MATHWVCGEFDAESCDSVETVARGTKGNRGSKSLGHGFWTKHDVIVAIATACATMATHWVCGEFDAESCGGVKTVVLRGIKGQNRLSIICPLVHVLPTAVLQCIAAQCERG